MEPSTQAKGAGRVAVRERFLASGQGRHPFAENPRGRRGSGASGEASADLGGAAERRGQQESHPLQSGGASRAVVAGGNCGATGEGGGGTSGSRNVTAVGLVALGGG